MDSIAVLMSVALAVFIAATVLRLLRSILITALLAIATIVVVSRVSWKETVVCQNPEFPQAVSRLLCR